MSTIDSILFAQFADAMNGELENVGATLRVSRSSPPCGTGVTLVDWNADEIGWLPEQVDAPTIVAIENIIMARSKGRSVEVGRL